MPKGRQDPHRWDKRESCMTGMVTVFRLQKSGGMLLRNKSQPTLPPAGSQNLFDKG